MLCAARGANCRRRRGGGDGGAVQGACGSGARADRQPAGARRRGSLRVRVRADARPLPADRQPPPAEAHRGGSPRTRAAREVGVLLAEPRRRREAGGRRRPEGRVMLMPTTANEHRREGGPGAGEPGGGGTEKGGGGRGWCCPEGDAAKFGETLYDAAQRGELPEAAAPASLGCGNPTAVAELR